MPAAAADDVTTTVEPQLSKGSEGGDSSARAVELTTLGVLIPNVLPHKSARRKRGRWARI